MANKGVLFPFLAIVVTSGTVTSIAGTARHEQRLVSTGISLVTKATPVKSTASLKGALVQRVPLAGTVRSHARNIGAATTYTPVITALAGTLRTSELLHPTGISLVYKSTPVKSVARLKGQATASGGAVIQPIAGKIRSTDRLKSTSISLVYHATPVREAVRLKATLPTFTKINVLGKLRATPARVQPPELTTTFSAAEIVGPSGRLKNAHLGFAVILRGTIRGMERIRSGSLFVSTALHGTVRSAERLTAQALTRKAIAGQVRSTDRLTGALAQHTALAGTARMSPARTWSVVTFATHNPQIRGLVRGTERLTFTAGGFPMGVQLAGRSRVVSERLIGFVDQAPVVTGTVRTPEARVTGTLRSKVLFRGTIRSVAVLTNDAEVTQLAHIAGRLDSTARLTGALVQTVPLVGQIRETTRLIAYGPTTGTFFLQGVVRSAPLLSAHFASTQPLAGQIRAVARLHGLTGRVVYAGQVRMGPALVNSALRFVPPLPPTREQSTQSRIKPLVAGTLL